MCPGIIEEKVSESLSCPFSVSSLVLLPFKKLVLWLTFLISVLPIQKKCRKCSYPCASVFLLKWCIRSSMSKVKWIYTLDLIFVIRHNYFFLSKIDFRTPSYSNVQVLLLPCNHVELEKPLASYIYRVCLYFQVDHDPFFLSSLSNSQK